MSLAAWFRGLLSRDNTRSPSSAISSSGAAVDPKYIAESTTTDLRTETVNEVSQAYYAWLFCDGNLPAEPNLAVERLCTELSRQIMASAETMAVLPRQPSVLPKLLSLIRSPSANVEQLVKFIAAEPGLATKVLSLANSPYYRISEKSIDDIERALVLLGADGLKRLVSTTLLEPILVVKDKRLKAIADQLQAQVNASANVGFWLANKLGLAPGMAHLLGLLRGNGVVAMLSIAQQQIANLPLEDNEAIWMSMRLFDQCTNPVAEQIIRQWGLGDEIVEAFSGLTAPDEVRDDNGISQVLLHSVVSSQVCILYERGQLTRAQANAYLKNAGLGVDVLTLAGPCAMVDE